MYRDMSLTPGQRRSSLYAAEPDPIRYIRRRCPCRSRAAGRRALSAAEPELTWYIRRCCPCRSRDAGRRALHIAKARPYPVHPSPLPVQLTKKEGSQSCFAGVVDDDKQMNESSES